MARRAILSGWWQIPWLFPAQMPGAAWAVACVASPTAPGCRGATWCNLPWPHTWLLGMLRAVVCRAQWYGDQSQRRSGRGSRLCARPQTHAVMPPRFWSLRSIPLPDAILHLPMAPSHPLHLPSPPCMQGSQVGLHQNPTCSGCEADRINWHLPWSLQPTRSCKQLYLGGQGQVSTLRKSPPNLFKWPFSPLLFYWKLLFFTLRPLGCMVTASFILLVTQPLDFL